MRLLAALQRNSLTFPLLVLIAQLKAHIVHHTESPHQQLVAELLDKTQVCIIAVE